MMLTAARFYSTPTVANARILFRASLLHLPLFMAAFLVHRLPNRGEDRAALLVRVLSRAVWRRSGFGVGAACSCNCGC